MPVLVPLVTGATYESFNPASLALGGRATEAHDFDERYLPTRISVTRTAPATLPNALGGNSAKLAQVTPIAGRLLEPTYDSAGLLRHHFARTRMPLSSVEREGDTFVLHFAGRPVALLDQTLPTTATFGDVQQSHFAWRWVEDMVRFGITGGSTGQQLSGARCRCHLFR